jgi:D-3-phosphoglycerate dehydrogenase
MLVATEISNIEGLAPKLTSKFQLIRAPHLKSDQIAGLPEDIEVIFTNPNNSNVYFGKENLERFKGLRFIVTASTGTIHIDKSHCATVGIRVISITKSIEILERITSTAELAFLLTLACLRNYDASRRSVDELRWDYSEFVGRQLNSLTVGVLGFGRLGKMFASYARAFGARVVCCDPWKDEDIRAAGYESHCIGQLFTRCDVVSLHIHADAENIRLIDRSVLSSVKRPFVLVNTSRGEIVCESSLLSAIATNPAFKYATDVISDEHNGVVENVLRKSKHYGKQIFITPHCGGMTSDARMIAYHHAADLIISEYEAA